jgi:hypothetical protein
VSDCNEDRSVYNGQYEVEVVIDRSVSEVWKQYLHIGSWVTSHDIEDAYGTPGTVGSITRVSFRRAKELGYPPAHYHFCKITKLVPERQYLLKTYSARGGSYGAQMTGFDDARFIDLDGKTKVTFNLIIEMKSEAVAKDPASMDLVMANSREGMLRNLNNLKRIVESH